MVKPMVSLSNAGFARAATTPTRSADQVDISTRDCGKAPRGIRRSNEAVDQGVLNPVVEVFPTESVKRLGNGWGCWFSESVYASMGSRVEFSFRAPMHLLIMYYEGGRRDGETIVEGVTPSKARTFANKLTFVPAGYPYREWHETGAPTRLSFLYFDPTKFQRTTETDYAPRVYFEDPIVWGTAAKLKRVIEGAQEERAPYLEALTSVLALELSRADDNNVRDPSVNRGGLAGWQKRIVASYVDEHLSEQICLVTLARLVRLSQHHFCRVFKRSVGLPPHQYIVQKRIELAKVLLAEGTASVTDVGLSLGYAQSSSFSITFRKITGWTPSEYRRQFR